MPIPQLKKGKVTFGMLTGGMGFLLTVMMNLTRWHMKILSGTVLYGRVLWKRHLREQVLAGEG